MARDYRLIGDRGAFLVAAELAARQWPAALTTSGTSRTDVLAQVGDAKLPAAIQVKTKSPGSKVFQLGGVRDPAVPEANEWVVLVALSEGRDHRFYVVPRDVVVATVQAFDKAFKNPSRVMLGEQEYSRYEDAWELLEESSSRSPWRLREWVFQLRDKMNWPATHAGVPDETEILDEDV
jgi:hypothetical protein